nr:hypothetical protein [Pirellulales bacterium]
MKRFSGGWALAAAVVGLAAIMERSLAAELAAVAAAESTFSAEALLRKAAEAGLAGDTSKRSELLSAAIAADPDNEVAHWQDGQVKFEGKWRKVDEVGERVANDPRWQEYESLRQSMAGTPADHAELARWCYREGLENEERYHWAFVLRADPLHELARTRLNMREYHGDLYTEKQIAAYERQLTESQKNLAKFTPIFTAICERAAKGESLDRETALIELRQVDDPAAIEALELVVDRAAEKAAPELAAELRRSVIVALSNIPDYVATQRLLNYSMFATDPAIRQLAAESLTPRPVTDYVPQLMAALSAPIQAAITSGTAPDGSIQF